MMEVGIKEENLEGELNYIGINVVGNGLERRWNVIKVKKYGFMNLRILMKEV